MRPVMQERGLADSFLGCPDELDLLLACFNGIMT